MPESPLRRIFDAKLRSRNERTHLFVLKKKMETFYYFYGVNVLQLLLRHSDNLSRTLQSP